MKEDLLLLCLRTVLFDAFAVCWINIQRCFSSSNCVSVIIIPTFREHFSSLRRGFKSPL